MISTDPVLGAAVPVYDELTDAYGRVKRIRPIPSEQVEVPSQDAGERREVQHALNTRVEDALRDMRGAMRKDLGVTGETDDADNQ
jgi:hypothetical protein